MIFYEDIVWLFIPMQDAMMWQTELVTEYRFVANVHSLLAMISRVSWLALHSSLLKVFTGKPTNDNKLSRYITIWWFYTIYIFFVLTLGNQELKITYYRIYDYYCFTCKLVHAFNANTVLQKSAIFRTDMSWRLHSQRIIFGDRWVHTRFNRSRSLKVINFSSNWKHIYDFLLLIVT